MFILYFLLFSKEVAGAETHLELSDHCLRMNIRIHSSLAILLATETLMRCVAALMQIRFIKVLYLTDSRAEGKNMIIFCET